MFPYTLLAHWGSFRTQGEMPNFGVGDLVLVARVRRLGITPKMAATWTGPFRVVDEVESPQIHNIVSGGIQRVTVAPPRLDSDSQVNVTAEIKDRCNSACMVSV